MQAAVAVFGGDAGAGDSAGLILPKSRGGGILGPRGVLPWPRVVFRIAVGVMGRPGFVVGGFGWARRVRVLLAEECMECRRLHADGCLV